MIKCSEPNLQQREAKSRPKKKQGRASLQYDPAGRIPQSKGCWLRIVGSTVDGEDGISK